jgi:hypothetical protein
MTANTRNTLLDAAIVLRNTGVSVVPVKTDKTPKLLTWSEYQERLPTDRELITWFNGTPFGIAALNGGVSGNHETIDIDNKRPGDAEQSRAAFIGLVEADAPGLIERLAEQTTPGGGFHFKYKTDTVQGNHKLAQRPATDEERQDDPKKKAVTLIETRGEGGYALVEPSPGYHVVRGDFANPPYITAHEQAILHAAAAALNTYCTPSDIVSAPRARKQATNGGDGVKPGADFNERGDVAPLLIADGWTKVRTRGDGSDWRRPGKKDGGISATLDIVAPGVFYVFSSNAAPFDNEHGYDRFAVYTLLQHEGDYQASTRALASDGYGKDPELERDAQGFALCPKCSRRLEPDKSRKGYHCPREGEPLCFHWKGEGYVYPGRIGAYNLNIPTKTATDSDEQPEPKPDLYDLGRAFAKRYATQVAYNEETAAWSIYTGTHWLELSRGTTRLRDMATSIIREHGLPVSSITKVEGVIQMAASHCKRPLTSRSGLVNFQNGTLELETMVLRAHNPADGLTSCLPYDYRPGAHLNIDTLLKQAVPDATARDAFTAFVGTAILRDYRLQYALLLLGPLRSGKSTLRQLANLACGNDRYACAGPELFGRELEGMRSRAAHNNQFLVTLEELPVEALRNEEQFKAMTAHGGVAQRRLHQPEITNNQWRPKLMMVTNEAPRYSDRSGALTDRLIIVNCPNSRAEGERDLYLLDKLLPEIGAFAVTCIHKAKEALTAGHYPQSFAMRAARDEIERNGDSLKSFVSEECIIEPEAWVETANLYQAYRTYCDENGQHAMSKARFTQALGERFRSLEPKSKRVPKPTGGTTLGSVWTRGIQGIRLRTLNDPDPEDVATPATPATPALHPNDETRSSSLSHQEAPNMHPATPATPESIFVYGKLESNKADDTHSAVKEKENLQTGVAGVAGYANTALQSHTPALHPNDETRSTAVAEVLQASSPRHTVPCLCGGQREWDGSKWCCATCESRKAVTP